MSIPARWHFVCVCLAVIGFGAADAHEQTAEHVVVAGEGQEAEHDQFTEMGEYAQRAWAGRSRMSSTTSVDVLSPQEIFAGNLWEAIFPRHGKTLHDLTQEIDFGLPHRFELGVENELGLAGSHAHETSVTAEARYACANWNAIPLNPAISAEYIFGVGKSVKDATSDRDLHRQPTPWLFGFFSGKILATILATGLTLALNKMFRAILDASSRSASRWLMGR